MGRPFSLLRLVELHLATMAESAPRSNARCLNQLESWTAVCRWSVMHGQANSGRLGFDWRAEVAQIEIMKGEFTAIIESAPEGGYWAICPEVPGANGQGETVEDAKASLREAIQLIFQDRLEDVQRGLPADAIQSFVAIG
jgi:predicted RNase H-like HicB family nuclease